MTASPTRLVEGYWNTTPTISSVSFPDMDHLRVELEDGRVVTMPIDRFPSIRQLTMEQRKNWYRYGNGFSFDDSDEVVHIEQILGNFNLYRHEP